MSDTRPRRPFVLGVLLTDEWAASPNMGETTGQGTAKAARMKVIRTAAGIRPVISGQAVGSWHRETLYTKYGWRISELQESVSGRNTRSFYTQCQPLDFEEDDGRGYLAAVKIDGKIKFADGKTKLIRSDEKLDATSKRTSPFMLSQFQSVIPFRPSVEFGILARGLEDLPEEAKDALIFKAEIAAASYVGMFALNLSELGCFAVGLGRDLLPETILTEGLTEDALNRAKEAATSVSGGDPALEVVARLAKRCVSAPRGSLIVLPAPERKRRAHDLVAALGDLEGGANLTRRLYSVAPSTVLVGLMDGGNCLPPHVIRSKVTDEDDFGNRSYAVVVDLDRLHTVLCDNADRFLAYKGSDADASLGPNLFFGTLGAPSIANADAVERMLKGEDQSRQLPKTVRSAVCAGPRGALRKVAESLPIEWFSPPDGALLADGGFRYGLNLLRTNQ